jgi:uncharacterized protein
MKRPWAWITALIFTAGLLTECKKQPPKEDPKGDDPFDRVAMLSNLGENIIVPAYDRLDKAMDSLQSTVDAFIVNPSDVSLLTTQHYFYTAYFAYQRVSTFEFGPADTELLRANANTFPCDTTQVKSKIAAGDFNLSTVADIDAKGFPAIDFLLYGSKQNNQAVLAFFTSSSNAANAKSYLAALVQDLKERTDRILSGWKTSGSNYLSVFKNNSGTSVGSSLGLLVNQLNFDLEILKNAKTGIPLGKKSLGTPYPDKVEAYYSGKSLALAIEHLKSLEDIYLGRDIKGKDGIGLDDYIVSTKATHPNGALNDVIKNKFISAKTKLAAVPETLSQSILTNTALVDEAYVELQQLVVLLKVDMPSALGVMITYEDNDGD